MIRSANDPFERRAFDATLTASHVRLPGAGQHERRRTRIPACES